MEFNVIKAAKEIFNIEIEALEKTRDSIDESFATIVELILHCKGKVIITGMGKPGHIGTKIAATLSSLGTPSFFMHPGEAMHGDLGMLDKNDVVILMSYSGESTEITSLLPVIKEIGSTTIAVTGNAHSTLARECQYQFLFPAFKEACYLHLAPTSSTTALLVTGDALAVVTSKLRNYSKEDFGLHHPAGALGKKLLTKVSDLMYSEEKNATVYEGETLRNAIIEMSTKGLSMVTVIDREQQLRGIITDGDLKRMLEKGVDVYNQNIEQVMTKNPKYIDYRELAVNALQRMNDLRITGMPVLDEEEKVIGSIIMQDIIKAGIVK
ncbi:MAG: KpsF/GutQ family sugar-phosphate isomerase [Bacteroidaceae bacterium]|nr:KpsF/GutQ family sugar-phosphate isomerase [Bacteroidaceae bacterium]MBQ8889859.1 KpsF/GutQ family sugar-phosphate isomerase [Bacteroidaceae bacterium]